MALTILDQKAQKGKERSQRIEELKSTVVLGEASERLVVNNAWIDFKMSVLQKVIEFETGKLGMYDSMIKMAGTVEEKLRAVDTIRSMAQQIENFNFVIGLPDARVRAGYEARKELDELEKVESNG